MGVLRKNIESSFQSKRKLIFKETNLNTPKQENVEGNVEIKVKRKIKGIFKGNFKGNI